jgi:hypothetical protein
VTELTHHRRTQLLRVSVLMTLALWIAYGSERIRAMDECDFNQICEPQYGENCEFCSDCSCSCGDNYCSEYEPYNETCVTCPEDCETLCICGDGWCDYPAEGGYITWPTCTMSGNPECQTCGVDCWDCQIATDCYTGYCDDWACQYCNDNDDCQEYGELECDDHADCVGGFCMCFIR